MAEVAQKMTRYRWNHYLGEHGLDQGEAIDTGLIQQMVDKYGRTYSGWGRVMRLAEEYNRAASSFVTGVSRAIDNDDTRGVSGMARRMDKLSKELFDAAEQAKARPEDKKSVIIDQGLFRKLYALGSVQVMHALGMPD